MTITTDRLLITDFTPDMAEAVHLGSLDEDTRRFLPDEVFPSVEAAAAVIADLMDCYGGTEGPFVHPIFKDGIYVGYVQLVPCSTGWEVGYHTVKAYTGQGYATEAVQAFLPVMMSALGIDTVIGVCDAANAASIRILEKCGFQPIFEGDGMYQGTLRPIVKMQYIR